MLPPLVLKSVGWLTLSVMLLVAGPGSGDKAVYVIVNSSVSQDQVSSKDVRMLFLQMKSRWSDGTPVKIATLKEGVAHESFVSEYLGMSATRFENYWLERVFTGKGDAPPTFRDETALVSYVATTRGALGYVSSVPNRDGIKLLRVQ